MHTAEINDLAPQRWSSTFPAIFSLKRYLYNHEHIRRRALDTTGRSVAPDVKKLDIPL
jgi:hypothetical protein